MNDAISNTLAFIGDFIYFLGLLSISALLSLVFSPDDRLKGSDSSTDLIC